MAAAAMVNKATKIEAAFPWQGTDRIEDIVSELADRVDKQDFHFQNKVMDVMIDAKEIAGDIHAMKQRHDDMEYRFAKLEEKLLLAGDERMGG